MNQSCSDNLHTIVNASMTVCYLLSVCAFALTAIVHCLNRRSYHPIFSFLFLLLLTMYVLSNSLNVTQFTLVSFDVPDTVLTLEFVISVHQALYIYLTCTVAMCVFERCFATIFMHTYEHWRPWNVVLAVQLLAGLVTYIHLTLLTRGRFLDDIVQLAMSVVIVMFLIFLLYMNVRLTQRFRGGNGRLSTRYQLTENIKILRLLVPVVVSDTAVCAADMVGSTFFKADPVFNKDGCSNSTYLPTYFIFRSVSLFLEWSIPFSIIYQQQTPMPLQICLRRMRFRSYSRTSRKKIKNVLGTEIQSSTPQHDYFTQLQKQWSASMRPRR